MAPDRALPIELEMRHPVRRLYQGRPAANRRIRDAHPVFGDTETDFLRRGGLVVCLTRACGVSCRRAPLGIWYGSDGSYLAPGPDERAGRAADLLQHAARGLVLLLGLGTPPGRDQ